MPLTKERKLLYPDNWDKISQLIREKANNECELCYAPNGFSHPKTSSQVVLTVHHINYDPTDNRRINLIALCQKCHNRLDLPFRRKKKEPGRLIEPCEVTHSDKGGGDE